VIFVVIQLRRRKQIEKERIARRPYRLQASFEEGRRQKKEGSYVPFFYGIQTSPERVPVNKVHS
jgi:hypothetical protein